MAIKPEELTDAVMKELMNFGEKTQSEVNDAADKSRKFGAKNLKTTSPKNTGKYAKGWTSTKEDFKGRIKGIIYNRKPTYRITHLLEHGTPTMRARVHIKPVEEEVIKYFENEIMKGKR